MTQAETIVRGFKFVVEAEGVKYWSSSVFTVTLEVHDSLTINQTLIVYRDGDVVDTHRLTGTTRLQDLLLKSVRKSLAKKAI